MEVVEVVVGVVEVRSAGLPLALLRRHHHHQRRQARPLALGQAAPRLGQQAPMRRHQRCQARPLAPCLVSHPVVYLTAPSLVLCPEQLVLPRPPHRRSCLVSCV